MPEFGSIDATTGEYTRGRSIHMDNIRACPHLIMMPQHYREDESCRCDDSTATEMAEWGYTWNEEARQWQ